MIGQLGTERDLSWPVLAAVLFPALLVALMKSKELDRLYVDRRLLKYKESHLLYVFVILAVGLVTSASVAISGLIAFVGLASPHLGRMYFDVQMHRQKIVASAVFGSILLLVSDLASRCLSHEAQIPSGSFMAILGAPFLIYLLLKKRGQR